MGPRLHWLDSAACSLHGKVSSWQASVVLDLPVLEEAHHICISPLSVTLALLASHACSGTITVSGRIELSDYSVEAGSPECDTSFGQRGIPKRK